MAYSRAEEEGRALAYVGSILLGLGIAVFGSAILACRELAGNWGLPKSRLVM